MPSLLSAAKYLAKTYGFTPIYTGEPMFSDPLVLASQRDTFAALHILASAANDTDVRFINVKRVVDWLGQKAKAADAAR